MNSPTTTDVDNDIENTIYQIKKLPRQQRRHIARLAGIPTALVALPGNHKSPEAPPTRVPTRQRTKGPAWYAANRTNAKES